MTPFIFVHYNPTSYLNHSLRAAKLTNPDARVILLGDESNKPIAEKHGCEHFMFKNYNDDCPRIAEFLKVFKIIGGKTFNSRGKWVSFVFRKWFAMHTFCIEQEIDRFWYFDTDVLVLTDLSKFEHIFRDCDYTKVCEGMNIKGLVNSMEKLKQFGDVITACFTDQEVIDRNMKDFNRKPHWGFTEMRASVEFERKVDTNFMIIDRPVEGVFVDTCLFQKNGFEMEGGLKKIYWEDGIPYCKFLSTGEKARMLVANCSCREGLMPGLMKKAGIIE